MLDDIRRNHDPRPTAEERAWMDVEPFPTTAHVVAAVVLVLMMAFSLSLPNGEAMATVAVASHE